MEIVDTTADHLDMIARDLDPVLLARAAKYKVDPRAAILEMAQASWVKRSWVYRSQCLAVGGAFKTEPTRGRVWLCMTKDARRYTKFVVPNARYELLQIRAECPTIEAFVDAENQRDLRFAQFLGFKEIGRGECNGLMTAVMELGV